MKCWPLHLPQLPYQCTICHPLNIQLQHSHHSLLVLPRKYPVPLSHYVWELLETLVSLVQASSRLYSVADLWMLWLPKLDCQLKSVVPCLFVVPCPARATKFEVVSIITSMQKHQSCLTCTTPSPFPTTE